jgi:uncharacterized protein YecE (DUF72 family)
MKFGKLADIKEVRFRAPNLRFANPDLKASPKTNIYLGTTGWSNKEWNGTYYPKNTTSSEFLTEYGKLFNTIELNSTHYHIPSEERVNTWKSKISEGFLFCPKIPQIISHRRNLASETSQTNTFFKAIQNFDTALGTSFMQLPEYFSPKNADQLLHFLNRKPKGISFAIELRHKDWFENDNQQLMILAKRLALLDTALVITDVAGRRDVCHSILSNQTLMIRLVGNNLHETDYLRMDHWIAQIKQCKERLSDIYVFFHQPSMTNIPQMVNYFIGQLEKEGLKNPIQPLKAKYQADIQLKLF